jgi:hypothetical protein
MLRISESRFSVPIGLKREMRQQMRISSLVLASLLLIAGADSVLAAGSEAGFKAAYAAAEAADNEAGQLRDQWTTTAAALAAAKQAASAGDFDQAIALSKQAEALARASIFQAQREKEAWKNSEIH